MGLIASFGKYLIFIADVFRKPERRSVMYKLVIKEIYELGYKSLLFVVFVSLFVGAVVTLQTAANMQGSWMPRYLIGYATRDAILLEFSPTIISLLLAGKIGSNIASSLGTMRVTEQIDALEVMGINSLNFLVLPKILAALFFYPFLICLAMCLGIFGGWVAGVLSGLFAGADYITGLQTDFKPFLIVYALSKTLIFSFLIATVPSYHGYYVKGGSIAVGRASTQAVVWTTILIVVANYILTQMLLT